MLSYIKCISFFSSSNKGFGSNIYNNDFITKRGIIESFKPNEKGEWRVFEEDNNVYYYKDRGHKYTRGDKVIIYIIPETKEFYKMEVQNER